MKEEKGYKIRIPLSRQSCNNTTNTNRCLYLGSPRACSVGGLGSLSKDRRGSDQRRQLSGLIYGVTRVRL